MNPPDVTVLIPYYEGQNWIEKAVKSVAAQRCGSLETIIVDDGSEHSIYKVKALRQYGTLRIFRQSHRGKGSAINFGADHAQAPYICILDQDDTMAPNRLQTQLSALAQFKDYDGAYSDYERVNEDGTLIDKFISRQANARDLIHEMANAVGLISIQTLLLKKDVFFEIGGFNSDISLTGLDDGEFFARLFCSKARLLYVPGIFGTWTSHRDNYSKTSYFNETRLTFLQHLVELSDSRPLLAKELPNFRFHAHFMRGIFFLEHKEPQNAISEFQQCLKLKPLHINSAYLLIKSIFLKSLGLKLKA